jgi:hypothetical protein
MQFKEKLSIPFAKSESLTNPTDDKIMSLLEFSCFSLETMKVSTPDFTS